MKVLNDTDHDNDNDFTYQVCNRFFDITISDFILNYENNYENEIYNHDQLKSYRDNSKEQIANYITISIVRMCLNQNAFFIVYAHWAAFGRYPDNIPLNIISKYKLERFRRDFTTDLQQHDR